MDPPGGTFRIFDEIMAEINPEKCIFIDSSCTKNDRYHYNNNLFPFAFSLYF